MTGDGSRSGLFRRRLNAVDVHVGARLRAIRESKGVSITELAAELGVTEAVVVAYECGETHISAFQLWVISKILEVPIRAFFR